MLISRRFDIFAYVVTLLLLTFNLLLSLHQTEAIFFKAQHADFSTFPFNIQRKDTLCLPSDRRIRHTGSGTKSSVKKKSVNCACPRIYCPVCGTDGVSYGNLCEYRCTKSFHSDLKIARSWRCEEG